jgi:hypothetical protein
VIGEDSKKYEGYEEWDPHPTYAGNGGIMHAERLPELPKLDLSAAKPFPGSATLESGIPDGTKWVYLDAWYMTKAFETKAFELDRRSNPDFKPGGKFGPELSADGKKAVAALGIAAEGLASTVTSSWQLVRSPDNVCVQPDDRRDGAIWYAYAEVYAPEDMELWCTFGSDDYGKCWINGNVEYVSGKTPHPWIPDDLQGPTEKGLQLRVLQIGKHMGQDGLFGVYLRWRP